MEPTTRDHTTWKHWIATLALLAFAAIIVPLIAALPTAAAYAIAAPLAVVIMLITHLIRRTRP